MTTLFPQTLAALKELYRDLDLLEQDLKRAGENLENVRAAKSQAWRDMAARANVAGPIEQLFYKIKSALAPATLYSLRHEIADCQCTDEERAELVDAYRQRVEYFAANRRALGNN